MLFDKMAKIIESRRDKFSHEFNLLQKARLFYWEVDATDVRLDDSLVSFKDRMDTFFLPFLVVAMEDNDFCTRKLANRLKST